MDTPPAEALERLAAELADVDVALARLDAGTYGTCELCGAPLADELLADRPTRRTCRAHEGATGAVGEGAGPASSGHDPTELRAP